MKDVMIPLHDRVLIKPKEAEEKTASGIIIPDTAKEKPQQGEVIAVGQGNPSYAKDGGMTCKVGDIVAFSKYAATEITIRGEEFVTCRESDVLLIVARKEEDE